MRKYIITFAAAVLIVGGGFWAWNKNHAPAADSVVVEKTPALAQHNPKETPANVSNDSEASQGNDTGEASPDDTEQPSVDKQPSGSGKNEGKPANQTSPQNGSSAQNASVKTPQTGKPAQNAAAGKTPTDDKSGSKTGSSNSKTGGKGFINTYSVEHVVSNPKSTAVLVNKTYRLPEGYVPPDLVYPNVPFIFSEKVDKRKMRKEAAGALEKLFAAAKEDGVQLAGVSGYRSESRQKTLYNNYVKRDGVKAADTYSARPGHSEHQTGLTIDVSGMTGKCAAESCFAGTKEAKWLAKHAHQYGFIIRYPEGKDSITGYKYEPWHLRYVGTAIANEVTNRHITLEQYFGNAVPVTQ